MSVLIKNGRIITASDDQVADIFIEGETVSAKPFGIVHCRGRILEQRLRIGAVSWIQAYPDTCCNNELPATQ